MLRWALIGALFFTQTAFASPAKTLLGNSLTVSARSAVIVDAKSGKVLYEKNPGLKLPPASTAKLMTVLVVLEKKSPREEVLIENSDTEVATSKAGLTAGVKYNVGDLIMATLIASSNDAATALARHVAGTEDTFARLMNEKAAKLGMHDTHFVNATGLPDKQKNQYSTAGDLTKLLRYAYRDKRIDRVLELMTIVIRGSDGKDIILKNHNKMLWKEPKFVKGKTGWTFASRHTFVGTNFGIDKKIAFALLGSKEPWTDIRRLASFGLLLTNKR